MEEALRLVLLLFNLQNCKYYRARSVTHDMGAQADSTQIPSSAVVCLRELHTDTEYRSGLTVITTCSPRNFDLVRSRGADHIFDYSDPGAIDEIKRIVGNKLKFVFDCIGETPAPSFCFSCMSTEGGRYITVDKPQKSPRENIETLRVTGQTAYGEHCEIKGSGFFPGSDFGMDFPAQPEHYEFCTKFFASSARLLAEGKLKTHPADIRNGGLEAVVEGLKDLKEGRVSGQKLVYRI